MNAQRRIETYTRVRPSITPRQRRRVVHKARGKERAAALALLAALAVSACSSGSGSRFGEVARVAAGPPPTTAPTTTTQPPAPPSPPAVTRSAPGGRAQVPPRPRSAPSDPWGCIRKYESGGTTDPAGSNIPGGGYYQFEQGTWASVGGHGRPSDASYEEQTARAQALQRRSGWGQWSTARRCGLV